MAYGALIRPPLLDLPAHGWVNLHFSLLPAWRGAAPVQAAIRAGDEVSGATTFRLEAGLDTGPVFGVVTEPIGPRDTAGALLERLSHSGAALLVATLDGIEDGTVQARAATRGGCQPGPEGDAGRRRGGLDAARVGDRPVDQVGHPRSRCVDRESVGPLAWVAGVRGVAVQPSPAGARRRSAAG